MIKASSSLLRVILCTLGFSLANSSLTLAQITPDGTVNTQVTQNGNVAEITGGETRDANLFHSFQDFSVPTGNAAFFNNASDIGNIFSRVTGGNISNIDGIISANGSANLFLINPAGIMFGENASLSIGGSFYGSTASSILFEDGAFSAVDLDNPPLLTVNAPVGLSFRDNPGDITANQATLEVPNGETLALLGGNLNFDGGTYGGVGGKLELGGLIESGTIDIDNDGSFDFPQAVTRGNITAASSIFLAAAEEDTSVNVNAKNLSLTSNSFIFNGIVSGLGSADDDAQAGDIVINLTEDLMNDNSSIANISEIGNIGNIIIDARNITFSNGGNIVIFSQSTGDPGNVIINATEDITFDSISDNRFSGITNLFDTGFAGVVGDINLTAQNLNLLNGANITSLVAGNTNSGDINLNIADTIRIEGSGLGIRSDGRQSEFESAIVSNVRDGNGNSGSININAQNLLLREGILSSLNSGQGNAGNININVDSLFITDRGVINGDIRGSGQGGDITINANESVSVIGNSNFFSSIRADIDPGATGEAGNIKITTPSLVIDDGVISADVFGEGNG
ncbi:MAG: filamentous hemagglutinin N-terminal domain-containing protein, partial [Cyanobacteria bacterium J06558_2]